MCWDNKNWAAGFVDELFANATHQKLMHGTSSMRTNHNHVDLEFRRLFQNRFCRRALDQKGCRVYAHLPPSIGNCLNLAVLVVELFRKVISHRWWTRFQSNEVWLRLGDM